MVRMHRRHQRPGAGRTSVSLAKQLRGLMSAPAHIENASLALRPVTNADGEGVAALIKACFGEYPGCRFTWDEFPELRAPATWAASRGTRMWVIDREPGIIDGCICATPDGAGAVELHKFYLASDLRGSGLANVLAAKVFACASETGARHIHLWTDTRFSRAHRFYEKLGFVRQPGTRLLHDISDTVEFLYIFNLSTAP
jgi:putative acetyltransferase